MTPDLDNELDDAIAKALGLKLGRDIKRMRLNKGAPAGLHYYREHQEWDYENERVIAWSYENAEADIAAIEALLARQRDELLGELETEFYGDPAIADFIARHRSQGPKVCAEPDCDGLAIRAGYCSRHIPSHLRED